MVFFKQPVNGSWMSEMFAIVVVGILFHRVEQYDNKQYFINKCFLSNLHRVEPFRQAVFL